MADRYGTGQETTSHLTADIVCDGESLTGGASLEALPFSMLLELPPPPRSLSLCTPGPQASPSPELPAQSCNSLLV